MNSLEWIVVVFAVFTFIKIVVLIVDRKSWWPVARAIYVNRTVSGIIFVLLAALIFYYLSLELSIVQIMACAAFVSLLMGVGFLQYSDYFLKDAKKIIEQKFTFWTWLYILVWVFLFALALYQIFY